MEAEVRFFPSIDDIFDKPHELIKYVFLPLFSIRITDNQEISDKRFHAISIWDNGNYKKSYFNDYRQSIYWIKFDYDGDKYSYNAPIDFPSIEYLKDAYQFAEAHFYNNINFYLQPKSSKEYSLDEDGRKGGVEIRKKHPGMNVFDSEYYFQRIISYLLTKERWKKYKALNSKMTYDLYTFKHPEEYLRENFNSIGKNDLGSLLNMPDSLKEKYKPSWGEYEDQIFLCHMDVGDFIFSDATLITLFYDKKQNQIVQQFEWD